MAVSMGKKPGGRRTVAEINITPFTDVCLVLLIIFMVSANFLGPQRGLDVKLPEPSTDAASDTRPVREVTINVAANDHITIDVTAEDKVKTSRTVTYDTLIPALSAEATTYHVKAVTVKPERAVTYNNVVRVMDSVKEAGIDNMSLAAQGPSPDAAPAPAVGGVPAPGVSSP